MDAVLKLLLWTHIVTGIAALLLMWMPLLSKKGGAVHRKSGLGYVIAMAGVTLSAETICVLRLVTGRGNMNGAFFLGLVGLLAGASTWWGYSILRQKGRKERHTGAIDWVVACGLTLAGAAGTIYGLVDSQPLFVVFGLLSAVTGIGFARVLWGPPESRMFWWYEHMGGMLVACISTVTAVSVVNWSNAPQAFQEAIPGFVVWVSPGVLGGIGLTLWVRHYRRKFEPGSSA